MYIVYRDLYRTIFILLNLNCSSKQIFAGSKLTAIEVWLITCIFFISITMMEYGFILLLKMMKRANLNCLTPQTLKSRSKIGWKTKDELILNSNEDVNLLMKNIDKVCLGLSIISFLMFNIVYWVVYW